MTRINRTSALFARHTDLGGEFMEYIRMAVPATYNSHVQDEHDAVREAAGMYDFTAFLKYTVKGPEAAEVLNHAVTFDVTKVKPGQSKYGPFLRETGVICDDGILFNLGDDEYMVVHGDGCARTMAELSAEGKDAEVEYDGGTHLISLQGPKALEILKDHTPIDLGKLKYFHHEKTEIFGCPCILSRTGFSGERGYEMFVDPQYACIVWDSIMEHGKDLGVMPCSINSIFPVRMEAALLWRRFDLMENTPWEVKMPWAVDTTKAEFRGKEALMAAKGKERFKIAGIEVDLDTALAGGEKLMIDGEEVGVVNDKPAYSNRLKKSLAIVRLNPEVSKVGTRLDVVGDEGQCTATVVKFPVYDTDKSKTHAVD